MNIYNYIKMLTTKEREHLVLSFVHDVCMKPNDGNGSDMIMLYVGFMDWLIDNHTDNDGWDKYIFTQIAVNVGVFEEGNKLSKWWFDPNVTDVGYPVLIPRWWGIKGYKRCPAAGCSHGSSRNGSLKDHIRRKHPEYVSEWVEGNHPEDSE